MSAPMMYTGFLRRSLRCGAFYLDFSNFEEISRLSAPPKNWNRVTSISSKPSRRYSSSYCVELVRKYDHENFLCTLLLPNSARNAAFAIRAFNVELARVRDTVSESQIGLMRLQFWADAVDKVFSGEPPQQPVALALHQAKQQHRISRGWLERLVDARKQSLSSRPFPTLRAMEEYSVNTVSPVNYLVLQCLDLGLSVGSEQLQLVSRLGRAQGVSSLLRATPQLAPRRICHLPADLLTKHALAPEQLWRAAEKDRAKIREVVFEVASAANRHLQHVKDHFHEVPVGARGAFLPGVAVESYLRRLQRADFDVFHPQLRQRDGWLPVRLWWRSRRGIM